MRNHQDIIRDAGHDEIVKLTKRPPTTVRSWDQRNSIPSGEWQALIKAGFCKADELIAAAAEKAA